jgi:hypothetical protein
MRGLVTPAFSASLAYFDSYRTERLQHNLLQAQRDYFGAHTYERIDEPGSFHTDWIESATGNTDVGKSSLLLSPTKSRRVHPATDCKLS